VAYDAAFKEYSRSLKEEIERFRMEEIRSSVDTTTTGRRLVSHCRTFPRQAQAFEYADFAKADYEFAVNADLLQEGAMKNHSQRDAGGGNTRGGGACKGCHAMKIFSVEAPHSGQRQFMAATMQGFWERVMSFPIKERHFYEIIPEKWPVRLYFDLEFQFADNPERRSGTGAGEAMVDILIHAAAAKVKADFGLEVVRSDWLELDSSTDTKFSRHLLLHLPNNTLFYDNIHVGRWVHELVNTFFPPRAVTAESLRPMSAGSAHMTCGPDAQDATVALITPAKGDAIVAHSNLSGDIDMGVLEASRDKLTPTLSDNDCARSGTPKDSKSETTVEIDITRDVNLEHSTTPQHAQRTPLSNISEKTGLLWIRNNKG
jgi:hypothetical protein